MNEREMKGTGNSQKRLLDMYIDYGTIIDFIFKSLKEPEKNEKVRSN